LCFCFNVKTRLRDRRGHRQLEESGSMSIDRTRTVEWDGKTLSGWVIVNGAPTKVSADRHTVHAHAPGFNDALTWEIDRHRGEIFEKLLPFFQQQRLSTPA
jgi:hypothetical protein